MVKKRKGSSEQAAKSGRLWLYYPDWVVAQSEIAVEEADAGIAAIDYGEWLGRRARPLVPSTTPRGGGGSFAAAARAQREAQAAVERSEWIVARTSWSIGGRFGPRR